MTTQLEVLNHVLSVVGEDPVSSADSYHPTAQTATNTIKRVSKQFQTRGWWFNKDLALTLSPNISGEVIVPSNTLKVDPVDTTSNLVWRGTRLYDPVNHTFIISAPVVVNIIVQLDIEELPEVAAALLMHKAAYDFYVNDDGDEIKARFLLVEVQNAWTALSAQQLQMSNVNAKSRPASVALKSGIHQYGASFNPNYIGGR